MPDICSECGAQMRSGARFCHVCGSPVKARKRQERERKKPDMLTCERCGKPVPKGALFCGVCGHPTKKPDKKEDEVEVTIPEEAVVKPKSDAPKVRPREEPGLHEIPILSEASIPPSLESSKGEAATQEIEIPEEMITILYARKRAPEIQKQLKTQIAELDALSEKMNVGLLTKKEAMEQLTTQKKKIEELQAEKAQLGEVVSVPLEIERLDQELKTVVNWEEKLQKMKKTGKVTDAVYKKVTREYEEKRSKIENQLNEQVLRLKQWTNLLKKRAERLAHAQETLKVKLQVEEITSEEATKKMKENENELEKAKIAAEQARAILQKFP